MEYTSRLEPSLSDPDKPSLFDLASESELNSLLAPTCRYLVVLLTQRHPRHFLRLLNSFDEVYGLLSLLVERYYLDTFGAGFTEHFYGLKREKVLPVRGGGEVRRAALTVPDEVREKVRIGGGGGGGGGTTAGTVASMRWRNLVVMVGFPYLKRKLDEAYEVHVAPSASLIATAASATSAADHDSSASAGPRYLDRFAMPPNPSWRQRLAWCYKWFLRKVYPSLNAAYHLSTLAFSLAYLFDGTKYSSPLLWLVGTRIRRLDAADYRAFAAAAAAAAARKPGLVADESRSRWSSILDGRALYSRLLSSLKILLPASIFALKFLEWWHASDFSRQLTKKAAQDFQLPPPIVSGIGRGRWSQQPETTTKPVKVRGKSAQEDDKTNNNNTTTTVAAADSSKNNNNNDKNGKNITKMSKPLPHPSPISTTSHLPILTVPPPPTSDLCPICLHPITNPTACQTGYVYDYKCIFQWIQGTHERQRAWMDGESLAGGSEWADDDDDDDGNGGGGGAEVEEDGGNGKDDMQGEGVRRVKENEAIVKRRRRGMMDQERQSSILNTTDTTARDQGATRRHQEWESGAGRCAITGRRVLGATNGLRRVMV